MTRLPWSIGDALRRARRSLGLTLHDVDRMSAGRFKPSSVGSYERGTRSISTSIFCELSALYGVPPDRLLSEALAASQTEPVVDVVIDLTRLPRVRGKEAGVVIEFVERVRSQRRGPASDVITLRAGDIQVLAETAGIPPTSLLSLLTPALLAGQTPA